MLFVPYSSMIATMLWRMPVKIEATTIAAMTPMTMPSTVRKLRNLFARTLSSAMASVSRGKILGSLNFIFDFRISIFDWNHGQSKITNQKAKILSRFRQRHDWIQARRFERRINSEEHANRGRNDQSQQDINNRDGHRNARERRY